MSKILILNFSSDKILICKIFDDSYIMISYFLIIPNKKILILEHKNCIIFIEEIVKEIFKELFFNYNKTYSMLTSYQKY